MSLSHFRDSIVARLEKRATELAQTVIDFRVQQVTSVDQYALIQSDLLAQSRALSEAARIVVAEYKRLTEVAETPAEPSPMLKQKKDEPVYG